MRYALLACLAALLLAGCGGTEANVPKTAPPDPRGQMSNMPKGGTSAAPGMPGTPAMPGAPGGR
jgi:hypothetical protein